LAEVAQTVEAVLIIIRGRLVARRAMTELALGERSLEDLYLALTAKERA
jgi:hypothetical protein